MNDRAFIRETSNSNKIKWFLISISFLIVIVIFTFFYSATIYESFVEKFEGRSIFDNLLNRIDKLDSLSLFYAGFFGGSIFIPMPLEFFFYWAILKGTPFFGAIVAICTGFFLIQIINYWIGLKLSPFFLAIISKKKVYQTRRKINKYGAWAIFIANVVPSPSELITFGLGITKYNIYRLFFFTMLGTIVKYLIIALFVIFIVK